MALPLCGGFEQVNRRISISLSERPMETTIILSTKIPLSRACPNHYLDSRFTLTVMIPEMMPRVIML